MTRDEAIEKATAVVPFHIDENTSARHEAIKFVGMAVALGILKLDDTEEKSIISRGFPSWNGI